VFPARIHQTEKAVSKDLSEEVMTEEKLLELMGTLAGNIQQLAQGQQELQKEVKSMADALKSGSLRIDPDKLKASTSDAPVANLSVIQPKNPDQPNLQDPLLSYPQEVEKLKRLNAGSGNLR
jgi:hypothetical protein